MEKNTVRRKKFYLGLTILFAASGTIFFFPMNIGGRYTCFYHRIFDPPQYTATVKLSHTPLNDISDQETRTESSRQHADLLHNYLHRYAFIWWGSVGSLALCIYLFLRLKKNINANESSLTVK